MTGRSLTRFEHEAVTAELGEPTTTVARRMRDRRVGCVVVTRNGHPVGIVTDRDLAVRVVAEGRDPKTTLVSEIVTYDATTLPRDAGIDTAARLMRDRGIRRLPIVDDDGLLTGIVTADDLTILFSQELADVGATLADSADSDETR
jgi:CBS domain-containing protein